MESILGSSVPVFIGLTIVVMGFCALLTGQAQASAWKSPGSAFGYALMIGVADRFLVFALFGGPLLHWQGFLIHAVVIALITDFAFRVTRARQMVKQYPWLYERSGPFGWTERPGSDMAG